MTISHSTSARNSLANEIDAQVNGGTQDPNGELAIMNGATDLAVISLQSPAFDAASGGSITLQGVPLADTSANASGSATKFEVRDKDNSMVFSGSVVSTGTGDMTIDNADINSGQSVEITSLAYSAPT